MLKKFPSDKINGGKNALFFLSRAPTQRSLVKLKDKVRHAKTVFAVFYF